jgi:serpin B
MKRVLYAAPALALMSAAFAADSTQPFAQDLFGKVKKDSENTIFSPASIGMALDLVKKGARGATLEEIQKVTHGEAAKLEHAGVEVANHFWGQKGHAFEKGFAIDEVDFKDAEGARKAINAQIAKETHDRIQDLLAPNFINVDTRAILTNAIWLKAEWQHKFKKEDTSDRPFTLMSGEKVQVQTMHGRQWGTSYGEKDGLQVLEMPYKGTLVFDVILPQDMAKYELDLEGALGLLKGVNGPVQVALPRFEMTSGFEVSDALKALGMKTAFSNEADFSGFSKSEPLHVSKVVTKTFIRVDEEGTEAAAATAVGMEAGSAAPKKPIVVNVDRPFFFAIRETKTGSVAFFGRIVKPEAPKRDK